MEGVFFFFVCEDWGIKEDWEGGASLDLWEMAEGLRISGIFFYLLVGKGG